MASRPRAPTVALALCVTLAAGAAACGSSKASTAAAGSGHTASSSASSSSGHGGAGGGSSAATGGMGGGIMFTVSSSGTGGNAQGFEVLPSAQQTLSVTAGMPPPTVAYTATLNGNPATATGWGVDQGNLGSLSLMSGAMATFTPSGNAGGLVNVIAALNGTTVKRQVFIKLSATQNGYDPQASGETAQVPQTPADLTNGGGVGGVGGTGLGPAVTDMPTLAALAAPSSTGQSQGLTMVYPYDGTVWPRGLPAPLLQWTWQGPTAYPGDADAILMTITTTNGSFSYKGTFGRPAILGTVPGSFINHPIPQDVWDMATNSAAGSTNQIKVSLTIAKGGIGYGPITQTWTIAPARLPGIIYYQSYGTQLAKNLCCNVGSTTSLFGGAVLSIHVGDTAPTVAAGGNSNGLALPPDNSGCRVCHSVASNGSTLIAVDGDNQSLSTAYGLSAMGITPQVMTHLAVYPAIYPDGSFALTEGGGQNAAPQILPLPMDTTPITPLGLASIATDLGQPSFSPDGKLVAFNPQAGTIPVHQTLYVMSFDKATFTFTNPVLVADDASSGSTQIKPGWPAFLPTATSLVYHHQSRTSVENDLGTREGSHAQVWWTSIKQAADVTPLDKLNGKGYLPQLPLPSTLSCLADGYQVAAGPAGMNGTVQEPNLDHSDDVNMNYEPTVNPVASGGYAWVVFTSRRMYGNVATIPPFCSDPRGVDLTPNMASPLATNITTKKLWVAAVDLTQAAGKDASHPAFYLPAQELVAGNARGFWTLDPCMPDGTTCSTGDQCCGGYCQAGSGGALQCGNTQPMGTCSGTQDKCTTSADCCDPTEMCVNGFCSQSSPM